MTKDPIAATFFQAVVRDVFLVLRRCPPRLISLRLSRERE